MKLIIVCIQEPFLLANVGFYLGWKGGSPVKCVLGGWVRWGGGAEEAQNNNTRDQRQRQHRQQASQLIM